MNEITWFDNYFEWLERLIKKIWRYLTKEETKISKKLKEIGKALKTVAADWQETKSKKLTVKGFLATLILVPLACFGLFGVMLTTLVLTQSITAVFITMFAYGAIIVILCIVPWKRL